MIRIKSIITILLVFIVVSCATVVPPAGGEKDKTPPVPQEMKPANYSANFSTRKIKIEFDEFVVLEKLSEQMVVSPEMPEKPDVSISGKKVVIRIPDSLSENTTYTIFFGNAIVNYKEGIPVRNFEYVFATGDQVDSLTIEGNTVNAFDHTPVENSFVLLYKIDDDSLPLLKRPYYLTKVAANGDFRLNNLADGAYKLFVLNDLNSNYIYDQPSEQIGFIDSLVKPFSHFVSLEDTTAQNNGDSITKKFKPPPIPLQLFMFTEMEKTQFVVSSKLVSSKKIQIIFSRPTIDMELKALNLKKDTIWNFNKLGVQKDTLETWLLGVDQDTLILEVSDEGQVVDTLRYILKKKKRVVQQRRKKKPVVEEKPKPKKAPKLAYKLNAQGALPFYSDIKVDFTTPILDWDPSKIKILHKKDTLYDTLMVKPYFSDPEFKMHLVIPYDFNEFDEYKVFMPDSVFFDIYGTSHDTISRPFETTEMRDYGSLELTITHEIASNLIVQLLDGKGNILFSQVVPQGGKVDYPYLDPGKYKLKTIVDNNDNGRWDTGDYFKKLQPERVYLLNQPIVIRANWDVKQEWIIED